EEEILDGVLQDAHAHARVAGKQRHGLHRQGDWAGAIESMLGDQGEALRWFSYPWEGRGESGVSAGAAHCIIEPRRYQSSRERSNANGHSPSHVLVPVGRRHPKLVPNSPGAVAGVACSVAETLAAEWGGDGAEEEEEEAWAWARARARARATSQEAEHNHEQGDAEHPVGTGQGQGQGPGLESMKWEEIRPEAAGNAAGVRKDGQDGWCESGTGIGAGGEGSDVNLRGVDGELGAEEEVAFEELANGVDGRSGAGTVRNGGPMETL
ncbi:unnamed protein product, partial [Discosporangium mesarthrocarpum]